jgi:PAS domain S-box-containing protein
MNSELNFRFLPVYADFLLKNKIREFAIHKLKLLKEFNIAFYENYTDHKEEQIVELGIESSIAFLKNFTSLKKTQIEWLPQELLINKFPFLYDQKIAPADISCLSFIQRKLFRDFLNSYTDDLALSFKIMEEVDRHTMTSDTICYNYWFSQREKEIKEKQNFILKIAELTPSLITAYNIHTGKYIFVNNAIQSLLGYTPEEILEKGAGFVLSQVHPEDLDQITEKNQKELEKANRMIHSGPEAIVEFLYRMRHKNGEYRWFNTYGTVFHRNSENQVEDVLNISVDITDEVNAIEELIKTNEELRKSEERYQSMISEVQDYSIVLLNKEGIIENWNKGAKNIKGYNTEDVLGKHFSIFYSEKDLQNDLPQKLLDFAILNGKANHEGWRIRKDGSAFWGTTVITTLHDKNGNVTGFTKLTRDLTEIKSAEDKLKEYSKSVEQKNRRLEQVNKELESFSYIASHDLQEPLRKIQAFTSRLLQKESANLSEWGLDVFSKIQTAANRMQKLIEALLNFSKLDQYEEEFIITDINLLLEESKVNLVEIIEEKKAIIESANLVSMEVIPVQFQQLLTNILNNALKYSKPNIPPRIKISSEIIEGKYIRHLNAVENTRYQLIKVTDNGIGFEQQYAEKIFELFQRLHGKAEYEGTGIGLSICKKIVENHGGIISAKGEPGVGAEFNMYFPIN